MWCWLLVGRGGGRGWRGSGWRGSGWRVSGWRVSGWGLWEEVLGAILGV